MIKTELLSATFNGTTGWHNEITLFPWSFFAIEAVTLLIHHHFPAVKLCSLNYRIHVVWKSDIFGFNNVSLGLIYDLGWWWLLCIWVLDLFGIWIVCCLDECCTVVLEVLLLIVLALWLELRGSQVCVGSCCWWVVVVEAVAWDVNHTMVAVWLIILLIWIWHYLTTWSLHRRWCKQIILDILCLLLHRWLRMHSVVTIHISGGEVNHLGRVFPFWSLHLMWWTLHTHICSEYF